MGKKLYVFEPAEEWDYCGGAIIAVADSFEKAVAVIVAKSQTDNIEHPDEAYKPEYFAMDSKLLEGKRWNAWLLSYELELAHDLPDQVLVDNWNYA